MATITVTNANNTGEGSLRAAIQQANSNGEDDLFQFDASLAEEVITLRRYGGVFSNYSSGVLTITSGSVTIDGDVDGDGVADIVISGDADGDGVASDADQQAFYVGAGAGTVVLSGLQIYGARAQPPVDPTMGMTESDGGAAFSAINFMGEELIVRDTIIAPGEAQAADAQIQGDGGTAATVFISGASTATFDNVLFSYLTAYGGDAAGTGAPGVAVAGIVNTGDLILRDVGFSAGAAYGGDGAGGAAGGLAVAGVLNLGGAIRGVGSSAPTVFFSAADGDDANIAVGGATGGRAAIGVENQLGVVADDLVIGVAGSLYADALALGDGDIVVNVNGFSGDDTISTGDGADLLSGGSGADRLRARAGDDLVFGGQGNDRMFGQIGDDTLEGGEGADRINGNSGQDLILGQAGADRLRGAADDDTLRGLADDDFLAGGGGNDRLVGGAGLDTLRGGVGDDTLRSGGSADELVGGFGDDTMFAGVGADTLAGGDGADTLNGGGGSDELTGGAGADLFVFRGSSDSDRILDFEDGVDSIFVARTTSLADVSIVSNDDGDAQVLFLGGSAVLVGIDAADVTEADFTFDTRNGGVDDDSLVGGAGDDVLGGGGGNDTLVAGAGDDTLRGDVGDDLLQGEAGADSLIGGLGADTLDGGGGADALTGSAGADLFTFTGATDSDRILDFEDGVDMISIASAADFSDLTISDEDAGAQIRFIGGTVVLEGVQASALDESDFVF